MIRWMTVEYHFFVNDYQLPLSATTLSRRILVTSTLYFTASLLEHILYVATEINYLVYVVHQCKQTNYRYNYFEKFASKQFMFIFSSLPWSYNHFLGFFLEYLNISYTFFWNFLDLFIILTSIGISVLFEKIKWRLQQYKGLIINETVWADIRYHHVQVLELIRFVNNLMGEMFVLSTFIDGYFILLQLLNITM